MWLFTTEGFVSVVKAHGSTDLLVVRGRDRISLEGISAATQEPILRTPDRDYPYRVVAPRDSVQSWISGAVRSLDYDNFKNEVAAMRGHGFAHALMSVWSVMHEVEDVEARGAHDNQ